MSPLGERLAKAGLHHPRSPVTASWVCSADTGIGERHEPIDLGQAGRRPAVVLSPASYDGRAGMMICCPATTRIKGYKFEVALRSTPPSVALADQVENQDWRARKAARQGKVSATELSELRAKLAALIG